MRLLKNFGEEIDESSRHFDPLVSVGIPTYNRPDGVRRTLECITGQTYKNLEIIVSDNCSPGSETEAVVREFMAKDHRVDFFQQKTNQGATLNFEFVLGRATGEYFMWVADDDEWELNSIEILVNKLEENADSSLIMSACKRMDENDTPYDIVLSFNSKLDINHSNSFKLALDASTNYFWTYIFYGLFRTEYLRKIYHHNPEVFGFDLIFSIHVLMSTKITYIPDILYIRKVHTQSTAERYTKEEIGKQYADPLKFYRLISATGPFLMRSQVIPMKNKMKIPFIVGNMIFVQLKSDMRWVIFTLISKLFILVPKKFKKDQKL